MKIGTDGKCIGAGGVFIQPLPGASEEILIRAEEEMKRFGAVSTMIAEMGAEGVLKTVSDISEVTKREIRYRCFCSREKTEGVVLSLGEADARELLKEQGKISVHCDYCNTTYEFDEKAVDDLFRKESK